MATESRTFLSSSGRADICDENPAQLTRDVERLLREPRVQLHALLIFIHHSWYHPHAKAVARLPTSPYSNMIDETIGTLFHLSTPTQDRV